MIRKLFTVPSASPLFLFGLATCMLLLAGFSAPYHSIFYRASIFRHVYFNLLPVLAGCSYEARGPCLAAQVHSVEKMGSAVAEIDCANRVSMGRVGTTNLIILFNCLGRQKIIICTTHQSWAQGRLRSREHSRAQDLSTRVLAEALGRLLIPGCVCWHVPVLLPAAGPRGPK